MLADVTRAWPADDAALIADDQAHPNDDGHALYARVLEELNL